MIEFSHPKYLPVKTKCWPLVSAYTAGECAINCQAEKKYWVSTSPFTGIALAHCKFQANTDSTCLAVDI